MLEALGLCTSLSTGVGIPMLRLIGAAMPAGALFLRVIRVIQPTEALY